ncbi:MAG: DNA polymerase III subunit gamma/tau [Pigmentiphaga sp.]
MTYLVLARKWRPRSFDTLVGQEHVVRALVHALSTQRLHHAWLFTGTRGVGKTTLSRILAKSLNCEQGITPQPCGQCQACQAIDAGRFVDYVELDAASNRGVDEMTQLLEQAVYAPTAGRFKVYMIDEVHMLSGHAFNAMLKTLEEPPPHVKFILATTDPQKIPVTVLSRCLQFNLKQMPPEAIVEHLQHLLEQEDVPHERNALRLLAQAAAGSMRDALSLTDQAIAYSAGSVSEDAVRTMLGTIDQRHLIRLLDALVRAQGPDIVAVADELATRSLSFSGALSELAQLLSTLTLLKQVPDAVSPDTPFLDELRALAAALSLDHLHLFYSIAVHSRAELALAPDEYAGFVMACLRMLAFVQSDGGQGGEPVQSATRPAVPPNAPSAPNTPSAHAERPQAPVGPAAALAAARAATQQRNAPGGGPRPDPAPPRSAEAPSAAPSLKALPALSSAAAPRRASVPPPPPPSSEPPSWVDEPVPMFDETSSPSTFAERPQPTNSRAEPAPTVSASGVGTGSVREPITPPAPISSPAPAVRSTPGASQAPFAIALTQPWPSLAASLPLKGMAAQLAQQSEWVGVEGHTVTLRVPARGLSEGMAAERLTQALSEHFQTRVRLRFDIGETGTETAHAVAVAEQQARLEQARASVEADPVVKQMVALFDAQVEPNSIRPVEPEPQPLEGSSS